ncbi:hypothetical protein D9M71_498050 [compost metagenome]
MSETRVVTLAAHQVHVQAGAGTEPLLGVGRAGRAAFFHEQGIAGVARRCGLIGQTLHRQHSREQSCPGGGVGLLVSQLAFCAFGFEANLQFGVALPFLLRFGLDAQGGERVELRRPVVAGPGLQLLELGPFVIR